MICKGYHEPLRAGTSTGLQCNSSLWTNLRAKKLRFGQGFYVFPGRLQRDLMDRGQGSSCRNQLRPH